MFLGDGGIEALEGVPLFAELPLHLLRQVAARFRPMRLPAGSWLFRQDEGGDSLFVLRSGRLELVREHPPPSSVVGGVAPGQALGELALLTGSRRALSARAVRSTTSAPGEITG